MINSMIVGCGQRIVWAVTQAIRATSLMSGVPYSLRAAGTPDDKTIAHKQRTYLSAYADSTATVTLMQDETRLPQLHPEDLYFAAGAWLSGGCGSTSITAAISASNAS